MSDFTITQEETGNRLGRYVLSHDGDTAELTYTISSPQVRVATFVGAPVSMRGKGVGRELVRRMVEDARAESFRIVPQCPFVAAERRKNPEWSDAFKT